MSETLILASASSVRAKLLENAKLSISVRPPSIDEATLLAALKQESATPHDIADVLAEAKARKCAQKNPDALVLGCDQVLAFEDEILTKPTTPQDACDQITRLQAGTHHLYSAAVLYYKGAPIWRHVGHARLTMRPLPPAYIEKYVAENWPSIQGAVGSYKLEEAGVRLFQNIEGDYFTILGLPLIPLLNYLSIRGFIDQ